MEKTIPNKYEDNVIEEVEAKEEEEDAQEN